MTDFVEIGYILKTHGYKGDVKTRIQEFYLEPLKNLEVIFLDHRGEQLPYFPESIHLTGLHEAIIHFEGLENKEDAHLLRGSKLLARKSDVPEIPQEEKGPGEFIGFTIEDIHKGQIGTVEDVYSLPQQDLLAVKYKGREVLIPLRQEFITEFFPDKKHIIFDLPEGILDL